MSLPRRLRLVLTVALLASEASAQPLDEGWPGSKHWVPPEAIRVDAEESRELIRDGNFPEAEARARKTLDRVRAHPGEDSLEYAVMASILVDALVFAGRGAEPETDELARTVVRRMQRIAGPEHPLTAFAHQGRGRVLGNVGDLDGSRRELERAYEIMLSALGPDHLDVAIVALSVGNHLETMGRFEEALPYVLEARKIIEGEDGATSRPYATVTNNLALLHEQMADFDRALELHHEALAIRREHLDPDHPDLAQSLGNLAILHAVMGNAQQAVPYFEEELALRERVQGPRSAAVSTTLNNLASVRDELGDLLEARALHERALEIRTEVFGLDHYVTSQSIYNLGATLQGLGDVEEADRNYREAERIRRAVLGADHFRVAQCLDSRGKLLLQNRRAAEALPLLAEAAAIWKNALGEEHPSYLGCVSSRGAANAAVGDLELAESLLREALDGQERILPAQHPNTAATLARLGDTLRRKGEPAEGLRFQERAVEILEANWGPRHPTVGDELAKMAATLRNLGRGSECLDVALEAESIGRETFAVVARGLAERQALDFAARHSEGLELALAVTAEQPDEDRARRVWSAFIRARAAVMDELAERQVTAARKPTEEIAKLSTELAAARRRLANLTYRGPAGLDAPTYLVRLEEARREKERLERAIAEESAGHRGDRITTDLDLDDLASSLPERSALLAFARFRREDGAGYLALTLRPDGRPRAIPLGGAEPLEGEIAAWHGSLGSAKNVRGIRRSKAPSPSSEQELRKLGERVRQRIWDPVASELKEASLIFVVPDGAVHFVCLDALPRGSGYLAEHAPPFHYLSAERELARPRSSIPPGDGLLVVGGPDFEAEREPREGSGAADVARPRECEVLESLSFHPLPGAAAEVTEISSRWSEGSSGDVSRLTDAEATESAVKRRAPGHRVLHLATHGFVLPEGCSSPLLRSGLALAGANVRGRGAPDEEDGILTAEEIASLDLAGVEWAVLSACETGLGEVQTGEGILGLRRSFEIAGAGTLISSLWAVDDRTTRRWMSALYEARYRERESTPAAVRLANLRLLEARRRDGAGTHPARWCGFVAAGAWD